MLLDISSLKKFVSLKNRGGGIQYSLIMTEIFIWDCHIGLCRFVQLKQELKQERAGIRICFGVIGETMSYMRWSCCVGTGEECSYESF